MNEVFENNTPLNSLRNFYNTYQKVIIFLTILLIFIIAAYLFNIQTTKKNNEKAAEIYNQWITQETETEEGQKISNQLFEELTNSYLSSGYSMIAILNKATQNAREGDLQESYRKFILLKKMSDGFRGDKLFNKIARINLARILLAQEKFDDALNMLDIYKSSDDAFIHEIIGDILSKQDKKDLAIEQYNIAKENYTNEASISIVAMKISNLSI